MGSNLTPADEDFNGDSRSYAISGKIMLSAIVVLFFVVILMFSLHLYARWFLLRARSRQSRTRRRSASVHRQSVSLHIDTGNNLATTATRGLDVRILKSLPVFTYSSKTHPDSTLDCAVCLSEFEENESGRILPKCNHSFHIECIDMWFHSHSTCPLCRTPVEEYGPAPANPGDAVLTIPEPVSDPVSGPGMCATCQHENEQAGPSSRRSRSKLSVEVPRRSCEGFEGESSACDSATSQSFRSPMSRMLSFTRILSRVSPRTVAVAESDIERGGETQG
ncbi:hypothetical protein SLE2022_165560 [Rubroshorea leprosula]